MPTIKVRGLKSYRSKGSVYHYHRATGIRIDIDLDTEPERFLARVRELDRKGATLAAATVIESRDETLGGLFDAWKRSEEWKGLKPQTRVTYERVIAPEIGALKKIRKRPLREFVPSFVVGVRDAVAKKQKRWMGNYTVKVLRTAFAWGRLHGWCGANPAEGVPLLPRPVDSPHAKQTMVCR